MKVPYLDLKAHHEPNRDEFTKAIAEVIDCGAFAGGPYVEKLEEEFAAFCGCSHAVGVASGTDALWLALLALGIGPGDEVITSPASFMATAEAISYTGATPVFVDIDETTYNLDPSALETALTKRTKAVIPVHLFGQPADMDAVLAFAEAHDLAVVEDAAQAHGAEYKGRRAGSMGDAGCFSFYPGKNLGAFGEAGAITTNDADLAAKMRVFRDHGQVKRYHHDVIGWNGRMDGIQGAVLSIKLRDLNANNDRRRQCAAHYQSALEDIANSGGAILPVEVPNMRHVWHIYALRVRQRDAIMAQLNENGIGCGIHYPIPIHLQKAYASLGHTEGSFPVAERCASEFLSLPMFPELTAEQIAAVAVGLKNALDNVAAPV